MPTLLLKSSMIHRPLSCLLLLAGLVCFAGADEPSTPEPPTLSPQDKLIVETVQRMKDFDLDSSAKAKTAVLRYIDANAETEQAVDLIERFKLRERSDALLAWGLAQPDSTLGVRAAATLFKLDAADPLIAKIADPDVEVASRAVRLIGRGGGGQAVKTLLPAVTRETLAAAVRSESVSAIGNRPDGRKRLLELAAEGRLPSDVHFAAANALFAAPEADIRRQAEQYFQRPATKDAKPLPTLAELVKRRGDPAAGKQVFAKAGTCINCHKVRGEGKEVGPDLSEIGNKLSREAMYVSILNPSLAISHNYESYLALTDAGDTATGLLVSETDRQVTIRTAEGIDRTFDQDELELLQKQTTSLMPSGLQALMTVDQLVDLVEYTLTLKKK